MNEKEPKNREECYNEIGYCRDQWGCKYYDECSKQYREELKAKGIKQRNHF